MNITPIGNRVLIEPAPEGNTTASGIIIPEREDKEPKGKGEIIAIGSEVDILDVGDTVLFQKFAPDVIEIDGKEYLIADVDSILATIHEEKTA